MQEIVVGVRFTKVGKLYNFDASISPDIKLGDSVVVETSRGWQIGKVAEILRDDEIGKDEQRKPIDRLATPRDLLIRQEWQQKEEEVLEACRKRVVELKMSGLKVVAAEYSFDGTRLSILYNSDSDDKVDLKPLRQEIQRLFPEPQVELRQIGPRDVAKILGGMGACGLETRCCSLFLTDFSSISIRMAKEQNISLTPAEITGMCGRLRCCLIYEYEQYVAARKELPKRNKRVITPQGEGRVVDTIVLSGRVIVEIPEIGRREFGKEEIEPADELERLQNKAKNPCGDGDGSGGNCGGACGH
jgi:cell fate regulator YaaT (PSP1 superfamily)